MTETKEQSAGDFAVGVALKILGVLICLYFFLFGLDLMGGSFVALFSKYAANHFSVSENPIAGLMVGVLVTVLLQSSSTTTGIVVGLVGGDVLSVRQAIPIIMGANIGTTVTNTLVSMAHVGNRIELERAFAGATVHDTFNMLSVGILLPLEMVIGGMTGEGGLLFYISRDLTEAALRGGEADLTFASPTKEMVGPFTKLFLNKDKNTIKALSFGSPQALNCGSNCTKYCVSSSISKAWKKVAEEAYESTLTECTDTVSCEDADGSCYTNAGDFFAQNIQPGRTIKGGFLKDAGDVAGGILGLILSLAVMCGALLVMVQLLEKILAGKPRSSPTTKASKVSRCTEKMEAVLRNDYMAILLGLGITIIVQSSSVTTSVFTPFVGIGVMPVHKMLPITLGANLGTTITPLLKALATMKSSSMQIAFVHLLFNLSGILIWFPVPVMRKVVLQNASTMGVYAYYWRLAPLIYILLVFLAVPCVCLLIGLLYSLSPYAGIVVTIGAIDALVGFMYWWSYGGCYRVVSQEQRDARKGEMEEEMGTKRPDEADANSV